MINRYEERKKLSVANDIEPTVKQYKRLPILRDRVFYLGQSTFAIIVEVITATECNYKIVKSGHDWFTVPIQSTDIDFYYRYTTTNSPYQIINTRNLTMPAMRIPVKEGFIFTPLIHCIK